MSIQVKKQSHIGQQRELASKQEAAIIFLLKWNYLQYCYYKYKMGLAFLDDYCGDNLQLYKVLENSRTWWGWWKNQWIARDRAYLEDGIEHCNLNSRRNIYHGLHNPRMLSTELQVPNAVIGGADEEACGKNKKVIKAVFGGH